MKLLVIGDLHSRSKDLQEQNSINKFLLKTIQERNVDFVAIPGDIFDNKSPNSEEVTSFIEFFTSIPPRVTVYVIAGNHDWVDKEHAATDWIPYIRPNTYYHRDILEFTIPVGIGLTKKFLMKHCNVAESKVGPDDINLPGGSIKDFGELYDVVILGHIHKSQILKKAKPLAFHPGSPIYLNFGERNDKKGIYLLDVGDTVTYEVIETPCVQMKQILLTEPFKTLDNLNKTNENTKVKVIFKGTTCSIENLQNIQEIIKGYKSKFHEFKYEVKFEKTKTVTEDIEDNTSIKQLLENFYKQEKVDKEIQEMMNKYIL